MCIKLESIFSVICYGIAINTTKQNFNYFANSDQCYDIHNNSQVSPNLTTTGIHHRFDDGLWKLYAINTNLISFPVLFK